MAGLHHAHLLLEQNNGILVMDIHLVNDLVKIGLATSSGPSLLHVYLKPRQILAELLVDIELLWTHRAHTQPDHIGHLLSMVVKDSLFIMDPSVDTGALPRLEVGQQLALKLHDGALDGDLLQETHAQLDVVLDDDTAGLVDYVLVGVGQGGIERLGELGLEGIEEVLGEGLLAGDEHHA